MNQLREEIKGLGHSNQFAPLLGLTLGLLVGRVVGRSHVGKPLTSRDLGQLEGELKKLSAESVADENLKRSIEYLQKSVSTVMNRRKKQSASGQLFAESGFFAEKSFVAASKVTKNVDGNVLHKMVLATKLMVISSYFTMHVKKSEKTKAQAGKFFSKAPEDHVRALLESKIVQDALQAELKTKQKFWEQLRKVSNFRRPSRKPSRQNSGSFQPARKFSDNKHVSTRRADSLGNKRTVSVEIGQLSSRNLRANSVNSRLGPNLSRLSVDRQERGQLRSVEFDRKRQSSHRSRVILDSREVLRAAVAVDRVYSSFNHGNRVGLTFNGQQVDPLDMPAVFELTYVPKKTSNRQELLSVLVDSKHSTAVTVNSAGVLEVFDKLTRESKSSITMNVKSEASSVAIDGRWIFVGFKSGLINVYDRNTLACFQSFSGHAIKINELIAESGRLYAVGIDIDQEGVILVWDLGNWSRVGTLRGHSAPVTAISVDSHLLVTVDTSGELFFWDTEAALPTVARTTKTELGVVTAMEARDGEVYIGEKNGALSIWDSRTSEKEDEIEDAHLFAITAITLDEEYLFTGSVDRSLRAWDKVRRVLLFFFRWIDLNYLTNIVNAPRTSSNRAAIGCPYLGRRY